MSNKLTTYALRSSVGPFSAGTRVNINSDNDDGTMQISVLVPDPKGEKSDSYDYEDMVFNIEMSELVELRPRSENVPTVNRHKRREFLRRLFAKAQAQEVQ